MVASPSSSSVRFGRFQFAAGLLSGPAGAIHLTPKERALLASLVKAGGEIVATATLLDTLWPESSVGIESLNRCVSTLRSKLAGEQASIETHYGSGYSLAMPVVSPRADTRIRQLLLQGREALGNRTGVRLAAAIALFRAALALDPGCQEALSAIANILWLMVTRGHGTTRPACAEILTLLADILRDDPANADALALRGSIRARVKGDDGGVDDTAHAVAIDPDNWLHHSHHGSALGAAGRFDESIAAFRTSMALNPAASANPGGLGLALFLAGDVSAARDVLFRASREQPGTDQTEAFLALVESEAGNHDAAIAAGQRATLLSEDLPIYRTILADAMARAGDTAGANREVAVIRASNGARAPLSLMALPVLTLEGPAAARDLLEEAELQGCSYRRFMRFHPQLATLGPPESARRN